MGVDMGGELIFKEEVYAIVGAAIEVHRHLRGGFLEAVYQEAFEMELISRGIPFVAQSEIQIRYKGTLLRKGYIADVICFGQILAELKVMERLSSKEEAQLLNYLNATGMKVGVLINFGDPGRLDWHRFVL
jgi:GxxExxY protein